MSILDSLMRRAVVVVLGALALASAGMAPALAAANAPAVELLMFERHGCVYCQQWDAEISDRYPLTAEGRAAPLRRVQLRQPLPGDIALARPVSFTPTFVLVLDGAEAGRIEGYPGEDFFWGLLQQMLTRSGVETK